MTTKEFDQLEVNLKTWTQEAGEKILSLRKDVLKVNYKADNSWVTNADLQINEFLLNNISKYYPKHQTLTEELSPDSSVLDFSKPLWIIDPIDGTQNYALGHYYSAVSIAYSDNYEVLLGAVFNPFTNEFFFARKNHGAFLNNQQIVPRSVDKLSKAIINFGQPWKDDPKQEHLDMMLKLALECDDFRRLGAGAVDICYVACGKVDAFFESLQPWDIAASSLIAKEAGCVVTHYGHSEKYNKLPSDLNPYKYVVACPGIADELLAILSIP